YTATANREVIVSSGSIHAALLQLSEVRDSDVLVIDTRFDLKTVGKSLQQQTMNSFGADGNFDYGASDAITYPNIHQAFCDETAACVILKNPLSSIVVSERGSGCLVYAICSNVFSVLIRQLLPPNRGTVHILVRQTVQPEINVNYFSVDWDLNVQ
ncbi:hypothetical protein EV421DRAFT_1682197, partial [Armillaria borealis]